MYVSAEQSKRARVQSLAEELYRDNQCQLRQVASSNAPSHADAEEALQEAFVSFITHFDPDGPAPALAWLILTLKRACWAKRSAVHSVSLDSPAEDTDCQSSLAASLSNEVKGEFGDRIDGRLDARKAMDSLKPDERSTLLLLGLGHSYKEIASSRGWTYTKVNRCISEGRAALRRAPDS